MNTGSFGLKPYLILGFQHPSDKITFKNLYSNITRLLVATLCLPIYSIECQHKRKLLQTFTKLMASPTGPESKAQKSHNQEQCPNPQTGVFLSDTTTMPLPRVLRVPPLGPPTSDQSRPWPPHHTCQENGSCTQRLQPSHRSSSS